MHFREDASVKLRGSCRHDLDPGVSAGRVQVVPRCTSLWDWDCLARIAAEAISILQRYHWAEANARECPIRNSRCPFSPSGA